MRSTVLLVEGTGKKFWRLKPLLPVVDDMPARPTEGPHPVSERMQEEPRTRGKVNRANLPEDVAKGADARGGRRMLEKS